MFKKICTIIPFVLCLLLSTSVFATSSEPSGGEGGDNSGIISGLLDGLKNLFIPSDDFFIEFNNEINTAIDEKTGGLVSSFEYISEKFKALKTDSSKEVNLSMEFEKDHFFTGFGGTKVDLLDGIDPVLKWIKPLISSVLVVFTVFISYQKVISMFKA